MPVDFENSHPTDLGYRPSELAEELDMPRGSVGTTLRRLEQRGDVRRRSTRARIVRGSLGRRLASSIIERAVPRVSNTV